MSTPEHTHKSCFPGFKIFLPPGDVTNRQVRDFLPKTKGPLFNVRRFGVSTVYSRLS
ncbi:hypothetical protein BaRGS_00018384, partial [Batillaria attramentaria]